MRTKIENKKILVIALALGLVCLWGCGSAQNAVPVPPTTTTAVAPVTAGTGAMAMTVQNLQYEDDSRPALVWQVPAGAALPNFTVQACTSGGCSTLANFINQGSGMYGQPVYNPYFTNGQNPSPLWPVYINQHGYVSPNSAVVQFGVELCGQASINGQNDPSFYLQIQANYNGQTGPWIRGSLNNSITQSEVAYCQ